MSRALSAGQIAATGAFLARMQGDDGALPWFPGGQWDAWNHTEALMGLTVAGVALRNGGVDARDGRDAGESLLAAARRGLEHLARTQRPDGSWPMQTRNGAVVHAESDTNQCAYPAVGVWHYVLATGDDAVGARYWPMVRAALEHVLLGQRDDGTIAWAINARGGLGDHALLTGNASILQSLWAGVALAQLFDGGSPGERDGEGAGRADSDAVPEPATGGQRTGRFGTAEAARDVRGAGRAAVWRAAGRRLAGAVRRPELFADRGRYSMDWFYPVLGGAFVGDAARAQLERRWQRFVWPGQGVRCVADRPWVTGGESAELVMALTCLDGTPHEAQARTRARSVFADIQRLRHDDGGYWTGFVVDDDAIWPEERTGWSAGALLLAADALDAHTPAANLFHAMTWCDDAAPDAPRPRGEGPTVQATGRAGDALGLGDDSLPLGLNEPDSSSAAPLETPRPSPSQETR